MNIKTFGQYLQTKRKERKITMRKFAEAVDLSPVYMSYIENNVRPAPTQDQLDKMIEVLRLDKSETEIFLDLAANTRTTPTVSSDLPEYIMQRDIVRVALRTAKEADATDEEWLEFINKLKKRIGGNEE